MLGDVSIESKYTKNYTNTSTVSVFPNNDRTMGNRYSTAIEVDFIKEHYYFFALDIKESDFPISTSGGTVRFYPTENGINLPKLYSHINDNRVIIIVKYTLEEVENIKFSMSFSAKYDSDVGDVTLLSMMVVDLGEELEKEPRAYENVLTYFSNEKSTEIEIVYAENDKEVIIDTYRYDIDNTYFTFTYRHNLDGTLYFRSSNGLSIVYGKSYLTYGYYKIN